MKTILIGSMRAALVASLLCLTAHASADVVQVNNTRTVLADGTVVGNDPMTGDLLLGGVAPLGLVGPTNGGTFEYAIRERFATQQGQLDRAGYSFFDFDVSNLTTDPTDPNFSAVFTIDYVGHLNELNAWSVDLGQVNGAWDTSGTNDPTRALSQGSTSVGLLLAAVGGQPNPISGLSVDITSLVQGWADGSIANNGLTFTGTGGALSSQATYFNNAVITTSIAVPEPSSAAVLAFAIGGLVMRRKRR